ncbi:hypothetical protein ACF05W_23245 [Streptomyces lydicus]|uniref:hypothetical protein n=1 Tax=Streptomyces lydicus TaxID=47763 RepID=UPI0036FBC8DA
MRCCRTGLRGRPGGRRNRTEGLLACRCAHRHGLAATRRRAQRLRSPGDRGWREKAAGFLQAAKLMSHAEAVQEGDAFTALARKHDDTLYAPIVAVSRSVIDKQYAVDFKRHGVVYAHVRDRDQNTRGTVRSLEDVVVEAIANQEATAQGVAALSSMMSTLRNKLYRNAASASEQLLRQENRSLGPNAALKADEIDAAGLGPRPALPR